MGLVLKNIAELVKRVGLLLCLVAMFSSCGSDEESKVNFAISEAEIHLNSSDCNSALAALEAVGMQNTNSRYLQTLSSAYACKGSYSTTSVFSNMATFNSSYDATKLLGGLTTFSTASLMTTGDDIDFLNNILFPAAKKKKLKT